MSIRLVNTCEQGADGSSPSVAANNGRRSGNGWDEIIGGTVTTTTSQYVHGTKSLKIDVVSGGATQQGVTWTELSISTLSTTHYTRFYFRLESLPATSHRWLAYSNAGGTLYLGGLFLRPDGKIDLADGGLAVRATSTTTLNLNQWYRIEVRLDSHASAGAMNVRLFSGANLEGMIADETVSYSNQNTNGAAIQWINFGATDTTTGGYGMWIDSIETNDYQYPGPFEPPVPSQYQTLFANGAYPHRTPSNTRLVDNDIYTMGMYFTPNVDGKVHGGAWCNNVLLTSFDNGIVPQILLYPGPAGNNTALASKVTTVQEIRGGWNYELFDTPVSITAGTTYMIAVYRRNYPAETYFFDQFNGGVGDQVSGNLTAPGISTTNNNYFIQGSIAKPTSLFNSAWYGLDVLFIPDVVNTTTEFWGVPY